MIKKLTLKLKLSKSKVAIELNKRYSIKTIINLLPPLIMILSYKITLNNREQQHQVIKGEYQRKKLEPIVNQQLLTRKKKQISSDNKLN